MSETIAEPPRPRGPRGRRHVAKGHLLVLDTQLREPLSPERAAATGYTHELIESPLLDVVSRLVIAEATACARRAGSDRLARINATLSHWLTTSTFRRQQAQGPPAIETIPPRPHNPEVPHPEKVQLTVYEEVVSTMIFKSLADKPEAA